VYEGWEVPIYYDPMISKLVAWGRTREEAIARMKRALGEYHVGGIRTTIPFFLAVLGDEEFRRGEIDTGYIARFFERRQAARPAANEASEAGELGDEQLAAAFVAAFSYARQERAKPASGAVTGAERASKWKLAGRLARLGG
jgi:acetyl-CoA carboxylase, biotin carboxylase subunit